jgi:UDP-glucose 4-epimerase
VASKAAPHFTGGQHKNSTVKILITGGAGYIGIHTCIELLNASHDIFVFDDFSTGSLRALERVEEITGEKVNFTCGDIRDFDSLFAVVKDFRPDAVVHFAGLKSVSDSLRVPLEYYDVNVSGTSCLLRVMSLVECSKIVFSSTAAIYGCADYLPYDEDHPLRPTTPYGRSKMFAEYMISDWVNSSPVNRALCLRYFNPVGAHPSGLVGESMAGEPGNLAPHVAKVALGLSDELRVYGNNYPTRDGTAERDYVHVCDLASAHVRAVENITGLKRFLPLNVGTGKSTTVLELMGAFEQVVAKEIPFRFVDRRPGDVPTSIADTKLAEQLLGIKLTRQVDVMCRDMWRWLLLNPDQY